MRLSKLLVLAIVAMLALASCSSNPEPLVIEESDGDTENQNPYSLTPTQFTSSKMKLGKLEMREFHEVVKANGIFDVPPQNHVSISAYFEGYVKQLQLLPGERVSKGQVLFVLENPGYVQVQQDFLEAQGQLTYLKSDYERQKSLAADNVTSQKNYLKAESDYTVTRVRYESLGKKLELMKINPDKLTIDNIRTTLTVTSPINGYVTEVNITPGSFLNPSDVAVSIVDTDHLHLELKIFEKDLSKIAVGQEIQFRIQNDRSGSYKATVHLVNKTVDPESRTIGIHGHLVDEKLAERFNPGMYVEAEIFTTSQSRASLPEDAVVEVEGNYFVLVKASSSESDYSFEKREVTIGEAGKGSVEILNADDFKVGAEFLVKGAFDLITE